MKLKRKNIYMIVIVVILIIIGIVISQNMGIEKIEEGQNNQLEIVPEEEISDEQLRETVVNLYYVNEKNEIVQEIRRIDSRKLIENPYKEVFEMLMKGTKNEKTKSFIPNDCKINDIKKNGEMLIIDLSKEFVENIEENIEVENLVIRQIVNTMTQFNEINSIKILIDGNEKTAFKSGNIKFEQVFTNDDE